MSFLKCMDKRKQVGISALEVGALEERSQGAITEYLVISVGDLQVTINGTEPSLLKQFSHVYLTFNLVLFLLLNIVTGLAQIS